MIHLRILSPDEEVPRTGYAIRLMNIHPSWMELFLAGKVICTLPAVSFPVLSELMALIVALRNNARALIEVAEAARRLAERPTSVAKLIDLRAALSRLEGGEG